MKYPNIARLLRVSYWASGLLLVGIIFQQMFVQIHAFPWEAVIALTVLWLLPFLVYNTFDDDSELNEIAADFMIGRGRLVRAACVVFGVCIMGKLGVEIFINTRETVAGFGFSIAADAAAMLMMCYVYELPSRSLQARLHQAQTE